MSSSTPSSPSKRSILSPRPSSLNINNIHSSKSPMKKISSSFLSSPTKKIQFKNSSPSPKKISNKNNNNSTKLGFTIWEDKIDQSNSLINEIIGTTTTNDLNHNDQENILQPKKISLIDRNSNHQRIILGDLDINEYKGFLNTNHQLTDLYQPINYNNEFKSLHKYSNIPNYCTPINKNKYIMKSKLNNNNENGVDDDELENYLIKKQYQKSINTNNLIRKHKRSMSVGKNESKLNFIKKNKFSILSN